MSELTQRSNNAPRIFLFAGLALATLSLAGCGANKSVDDSDDVLPIDTSATLVVDTETDVATTTVNANVTSTASTTPIIVNVPSSTVSSNQVKTTSTSAVNAQPSKRVAVSSVFKDGTYTTVGTYNSPAGSEELGVRVTLKDDIIVETESTVKATVPPSVKMQQVFIANYKPLVIGKKITEVHLTKVSGSSLTPAGFNNALVKIEAQAKR
jgi:hypothetical protein